MRNAQYRHFKSFLVLPCLLALSAVTLRGQFSYTGGLVKQDFNSLPRSGSFDYSDAGVAKGPAQLIDAPVAAAGAAGWGIYAQAGTQLLFIVDHGLLGTASAYSYGPHGSNDRALGSLAGSNHRAYLGWRLANHTGKTITQFTLSLFGEQWRNGGTALLAGFEAEFRIAASGDIHSGTYIQLDALDVPGLVAISGSDFALNGNAPAYRLERSATVTELNWQPNQLLIVRWRDIDEAGADNGLAVDDVLFFAPTTVTAPAVDSISPANGSTLVLASTPITVTFNQPVTFNGDWFEIVGSISGTISATVSNAGPLRCTLTPNAPLASGETVSVRIIGSQVTNAGGQSMAEDWLNTFSTLPAVESITPIHNVQGTEGYSPLAGAAVTVQGVVTADFQGGFPALGGFYLQEEEADADDATSEGIWIPDQGSAAAIDVAAGDVVRVTGTVSEDNNLTQLVGATAIVRLGATSLPPPVVIEFPLGTPIFLERHEGMLVEVPQTLTVTAVSGTTASTDSYARFGELLLASHGPLEIPTEFIDPNDLDAAGTTSAGKINVPAIHAQERLNALRGLILDDASRAIYPNPTPHLNVEGTRRCGDTVTGLRGVMTYANSAYRMQPTGPVPFVDSNPRPLQPPAVAGRIKVAAMNVLNYFTTFGGPSDRGADNDAEFQRQKAKIMAALVALDADVLGLIEIQNTSAAVSDMINALNGAIGSDEFALVPDPPGGASGDVIRSVLLYRPSKVSLIGPCHADYDGVWSTSNPLRYPLAQVFEECTSGERFIACLNHWKSKSSGGASGLNLDQNDGQAAYNEQRRLQSARVHAWLQSICAEAGDDDALIMGDLNSYGEEDPLDILRANGYFDQGTRFHANDYSYRIGGQRGRLDHAFATATMAAQILGVDHWHINADEPAFYDYNTENKTAAQLLINSGTPFRSSDHDPVLMGISLSPQPTTYAMWAAARPWLIGADTSAAADADGDGMVNLLEYALNAAPDVADASLQPVAARAGAAWQIRYRQRTNATGVAILPQWSEDLTQWHDITMTTPVQQIDARTELRQAEILPTGQRLFLRLKVVLMD